MQNNMMRVGKSARCNGSQGTIAHRSRCNLCDQLQAGVAAVEQSLRHGVLN